MQRLRKCFGTGGRWVTAALIVAWVVGWLAPGALAQERLMVYAIIQQIYAAKMLEQFEAETGVKADFVRGAGGQIVSRVIAERGNPRGDVVLGGASNLHETLKAEGALVPYSSELTDAIAPNYRDPEGYWHGFYVTAMAIGINPDRYRRLYGNKPLPRTWDDLADPAFRGEISIADPVTSSGTYLFVNLILQDKGWDAGWAYLERLYPLVGQWPTSSAAPPRQVGQGEYTIAVTFAHSLSSVVEEGYRVEVVYPPRTGGDVGSVSLIAGGPNPTAARIFLDWVMGKSAQQLHTDISYTTPTRTDIELGPGVVSPADLDFIDYDPIWAGQNRDRILDEWTRRFGG